MKSAILALALTLQTTTAAAAASCENDIGFEGWMIDLQLEALDKGISPDTFDSAEEYLTLNPEFVRLDRNQGVFLQSFLEFSERMASNDRIRSALKQIEKNRELFDRVESEYGVPPQVIASFWGLESDFGANTGKYSILTALTTLAYDCRRPDHFRGELIATLGILERGDLRAKQMIGNWAGELGGLQISPSHYLNLGVDYDGDGRRDLIRNVPDTIASAAALLVSEGWQAGQPWLQEVKVPKKMDWKEADLATQHSVSQWERWGVKAAEGDLADGEMQASLLLPMGRLGPAFLAYPNFRAFLGWNSSMVYSTTAAYLATRINGASKVGRGRGEVYVLSLEEMMELQRMLGNQGHDVGKVDGKLGEKTRAAVKQMQLQLGLPADSYPSLELLERMRQI